MIKKIGVLAGVIILLSLAFVFAIERADEIGPIQFGAGWNIVYGFTNPEQLGGQVLESSNIRAIYAFVPTTQEYARVFPEPEEDKLNLMDYDEIRNSALWVYSDRSGESEYWLEREPTPYNFRQLYSGWNFLGITYDMRDKTMSEIQGSCNFLKIYHFDSFSQKWSYNFAEDDIFMQDTGFDDQAFGQGLVVKVSSDCMLGGGGSGGPPPLPGGLGGGSGRGLNDFDSPPEIGDYVLKNLDEGDGGCEDLNGVEVCVETSRLEYVNENTNRTIQVIPVVIESGYDEYFRFLSSMMIDEVSEGVFRFAEEWELGWFTEEYDLIMTQDYTYVENDFGTSSIPNRADTDNPVIGYFLGRYPPIE